MALLKNTTINSQGALQVPSGTTSQRPTATRTVVSFTATGAGTWTVPADVTSVQVLVVGGGGAAGYDVSGGGGAGGVVFTNSYAVTPGQVISYNVGAGGAGGSSLGNNGTNSVFGTITAYGGGGGAYYYDCLGKDGGSGGGGVSAGPNTNARVTNARGGGRGVAGQGNNGGGSAGIPVLTGSYAPGGGGGAGEPGGENYGYGAKGGNGLPFSITGTPTWYGGGGGAGGSNYVGKGGLGGGGDGDTRTATAGLVINGSPNTGGGGGGSAGFTSGAGGSGVIIVSYVPDSQLGQIRYNSDGGVTEVFETGQWESLSTRENYGTSNALPFSNELTQSVWTKENVTLTSGQLAPDGSSTAYLMTETAISGDHRIYQLPIIGQGGPSLFIASVYVKYNNSLQYFLVRHSGSGGYCYFDILNRKVTESINGAIGEIIPAENGWLQLKVTTFNNAYSYGDVVYAMSTVGTAGGTNPVYVGNGTRNVLIWKPELCTATDIEANGYRTHIYRNLGPNQYFTPNFTGSVEVLVVGGGGSGASTYGGIGNGPRGGGGGGGVIYIPNYQVTSNTMYAITVGAGGAAVNGNNVNGNQGNNSRFDQIVALGGGHGGYYNAGNPTAGTGGSGGGNAYSGFRTGGQPGAGNYGSGSTDGAGGGGGAGSPGAAGPLVAGGGAGGRGIACDISGTTMWYGGGGGAGGYPQGKNNYGLGGLGGGGRGGQGYDQSSSIAGPQGGWDGTGGGGGGGGSGAEGGKGGHGIVIVRYQAPTKCSIFYQSGYWTCPPNVSRARVLVVAGGGGGGMDMGGGGGAGGVLYEDSYPVDPGRVYTVTVGTGGAGARARNIASERGQNGNNSVFGSLTAIGGGGGASFHDVSTYPAGSGGSGGGASGGGKLPSGGATGTGGYGGGARGAGTPGQGNNGADSIGQWYPTGGGGAGTNGYPNPGHGGSGLPFNIAGTMLYYAGGGGGSGYSSTAGDGGLGGGGGGASGNARSNGGGWALNWGQAGHGGRTGWQIGYTGSHAGANTGGGGGGGAHYNNANEGGDGGSGVVIIKWD